MKIIYNKILPFKGFEAISLFGVIFAREEYKPLSKESINHEKIHFAQQKEWLYIFFFILYFIEWIFKGYKNISFEKEAKEHEKDDYYLQIRPRFNNYIRYE